MIRVLHPWFLFLLLLIPVVWYSAKRVRVLGQGRKALTLLLRSLVLILFIMALAEVELVDKGDSLTVLFAIDRSSSIPNDEQMFSLAYVQERLMELPEGDNAGILFFGKEAMLKETPRDRIQLDDYNVLLNKEGTDIESAINLSMAAFPAGVQKRIVLITDGNQTQGDAESAVQRAKANNIDLHIMPLEYVASQEVLIEQIALPNHIQEKEPFKIKVLVNAQEEGPGVLRIMENDNVITEENVQLSIGKNAFWVPRAIEQSGVYTYTAVIEAENDRRPLNNRAENFAFVQGMPRVLLLDAKTNDSRFLASALISEGIQVDLHTPEALPGTLRELQMYDSVIISNVHASEFSKSQLTMLETGVSDLGIGLVMIGGPDSFGAGGYQGTPVERALPIDMDIKQRKIIPSGALTIIMHSCEIPQGNYWTQEISLAALDALSRNDYIGLLRYGPSGEGWLFPLERAGNKNRQRNAIKNLPFSGIGDMPSFATTMQMALDGFKGISANIKHMIILSDGDPALPSQGLIDEIVENKITISTICVGTHAQQFVKVMRQLAEAGKGKAYNVKNNKNLPRIFVKEAMTVRRHLIEEGLFTPAVTHISEILQGLDSGFPELSGYVITSPKSGAETVMITHKKDPLLAHWRYGLGKTVAFTSDAKAQWAEQWIGWDNYAKFWGQAIRWTLRSSKDDRFQIKTSIEGDQVKCVVDALTEDGGFLNNLTFGSTMIDPKYKSKKFDMRQTEPGRYEGYFPLDNAGSYLVTMTYEGPDDMEGILTSGISIPYSPEHNSIKQNDLILKRLAEVSGNSFLSPEINVFDHNLTVTGDMLSLWPWLLGLAVFFFFCDIAVRRVFFELPQLKSALVKAWNWFIAPFRLKPAAVGPATEEIGQLMQAKTRADDDIVYAEEKESFLERLESVKESDLEELESIGTAPKEQPKWQEVKNDDELEKFEDEPQDAYTNALLRAKNRAKGNINERR